MPLMEHTEFWPGMGRAGRDFVEEHYGIEMLNDGLIGIYEDIVAKPDSGVDGRGPLRQGRHEEAQGQAGAL